MKRTQSKKEKQRRPLGDLELEIMKVLWEKGEATGREVWEGVRTSRKAALTTVLTVMERLSNKGLIEKVKRHGPFVYRPLLSKDEFTREVSAKMLRDYIKVSSTSVIASFVDALAETDPGAIEQLSEFIEKKKRRLK